jgi:cation:H+ antiporter
MIWKLLQLVLALLLLGKAAEWFARGAGQVAALTGLSRLLLGAVLIGCVTNLPELLIAVKAAWLGHTPIAVGNAVGSNIFNMGLVLGCCLLRTGSTGQTVWLRDQGLPMLFAGLVLYGLVLFGDVTRPVAMALLALLAFHLVGSIAAARARRCGPHGGTGDVGSAPGEEEGGRLDLRWRWSVAGVLFAVSVPLLFLTSGWALESAIALARAMDVSEIVIALTLVAAGTSLPELATALVAARRGHLDTALGIVLGSCLYNALGVIGAGGLVAPLIVSGANRLWDLPVMLLVMSLPLAGLLRGRFPGRKTGWALVSIYGLYTYSLFTLYEIF